MLKEFAQYLSEMRRPELVEAEGRTYSTRQLHLINEGKPAVSAFIVRNLSGVVDYVKSKFDNEDKLIIHVESPTQVNLFDALDSIGERRTYVRAKAMLPDITYDRFLSREAFNIQLQSCFVDSTDKSLLLQLISTVVEDEGVKTTDTGVSQKVVVKTGITTAENVETKENYALKPFRTFVEVEQPYSSFILRLKEGAQAALFSADGGAWELNAIQNIRDYFQAQLADEIAAGRIRVIA